MYHNTFCDNCGCGISNGNAVVHEALPTSLAASVVVLPGLPLLPLMFSSQVVNAVLLPLHVVALLLLARDERTMGSARAGTVATVAGWCCLGLIVACVAAMTVQWL